MTTSAARVLVIDDDLQVARVVTKMLVASGYVPLAPVTRARDATHAVRAGRPDVVLLDVLLDGGADGITVGLDLRAIHEFALLVVSGQADPATLHRVGKLAPEGFVVKPFVASQLLASVATALAARRTTAARAVSQERAGAVERASADEPPAGVAALSPREREIAAALCAGRRVKGIAAERGLSEHTIRNQVKSILAKLSVHSQEELVLLLGGAPKEEAE